MKTLAGLQVAVILVCTLCLHTCTAQWLVSLLAGATLALPSLAHAFHAPAEAHSHALSIICAAVLLVVFVCTLPLFLQAAKGEEHSRRAGR